MSHFYRPSNPWDDQEPERETIRDRLVALGKRLVFGAIDRIPGGETGKKAAMWAAIFHLVVLIVAAIIVVVPRADDTPEIIAEVIVPERTQDVQMQRLSAVKQLKEVRASASASVAKLMRANTPSVIAAPEVEMETLSPLGMGLGDLGNGVGLGAGGAGGGGMNVSKIPATMRGRCIPGERARLLHENGGTPEVEAAVMNALDWLQSAQNRDGSWGGTYEGAMTGFALLCYLGHCETPQSPRYGETVTKGIQALLEMAQRNGGRLGSPGDKHWAYEHGIGTYALGEALILTREEGSEIPQLEETYEAAVKLVIDGQNSDGGWVYGYSREGAGDLSVTGWQFQALKTAQHARISLPGLDKAISKTAQFVAGRQGPKGGFGYKRTEDRHSLTGVGLLGLQYLSGDRGSRIKKGFDFYLSAGGFDYNLSTCDLYSWYYMTLAAFNHKGDTWKEWNGIFRDQLIQNQDKRGRFNQEGSAKTDRSQDPEIYRTCLCILMLEVYYRYLPATG
ncbi:MAG: terpene cyclase/mutase family protein [Verrucomicrobiae bacterium]|nr:terpene cyclase/mutase family protein [Verrucomicrobiae bacterium]